MVARGAAKAVAVRAAVARYQPIAAELPGRMAAALHTVTAPLAEAEAAWGGLALDPATGGFASAGAVDLKRLMALRKARSLAAGGLATVPVRPQEKAGFLILK